MRIVPNPKRKGQLNTHKTARKIRLRTLLVVSVKRDNALYLTMSSGCWVKRDSHIGHGVMTVAFLMTQTGYPELQYVPYYPYNAAEENQTSYLDVVRR
jgi:hypothetical protein